MTNGAFTLSLVRLLLFDATHGQHVSAAGGVIAVRSGPRVAEARNSIVLSFLSNRGLASVEWLWFVDADMTFEPDTLERLLAVADPRSAPIVGGLCFEGGVVDHDGGHEALPAMFRVTSADGEPERVTEWAEDSLVPVDATGAACLLIHWSVLARMFEKFRVLPSGVANPYPWFVEGMVSPRGAPYGEDTAFCVRARSLGFPIVVDTSVRVGHMKLTEVGGPKRPTVAV